MLSSRNCSLEPGSCRHVLRLLWGAGQLTVGAHCVNLQDGMHSQSCPGPGSPPLHMNARIADLSPAQPQDAHILLQPSCSQSASKQAQQQQQQGIRLQLSRDLAGLTSLLSVGEHMLVTHVQLAEHPLHGPCMQVGSEPCLMPDA